MLRCTVVSLAELIYRLANVVLSVSALVVGALIVIEISRRPTARREPLGMAIALVFVAVGGRAAVRSVLEPVGIMPTGSFVTIVAVDLLAAGSAVAFLALHRRYAVFIESADMVREYETEYAAKEREARALAQVNEELRRLDELKSEFLAMVSHELRTPLTAIVGYSRLLMRQVHGPLTPKQLEHQEAIFRSAQRLTELINDLLDVSRLEAARVELDPRPTDVREAVEHVVAAVRVASQAKQIRIANAVGSDVPAVHADATRLHQILVNLVGNAVKFTPAGGAVTVRAARQGDQVWIAVEETASRVEPVLAGRDVLIVDDALPNQDLMRTVVEDLLGGHATISADGEAAVQLALEHPPAVILLDLMLPGLSGWEVARRLRQHPHTRNIPIIAVSALARPQERASAFHPGCEAYVAKPYTPDDLARVVAATMAGAGALSR